MNGFTEILRESGPFAPAPLLFCVVALTPSLRGRTRCDLKEVTGEEMRARPANSARRSGLSRMHELRVEIWPDPVGGFLDRRELVVCLMTTATTSVCLNITLRW